MTIKLPPKPTSVPTTPVETPASETQATDSTKKSGITPHATDSLDAGKTSNTKSEVKVNNGLTNPTKAQSKVSKAASVSAPPGISTLTINDLVGTAPGKRWDVGDPVAASTMLQRFLHSDVNYAENELEALPTLKTMIQEQTRYYEGADATLYDLFQSHPEHKLTDAIKAFVHGQSSQLEIDGEVINDPAVLNAVKALNIAQHPLRRPKQG